MDVEMEVEEEDVQALGIMEKVAEEKTSGIIVWFLVGAMFWVVLWYI